MAQAVAREVSEGLVEQAIDGPLSARFRKELRPVAVEGGRIVLVRKRLLEPGRATRGAVLLLHGYAQNRYAWHTSRRSLANFLAAEGWDVFNLDLRGAGRSREHGTPAARSFADHVEGDLPAAVAEALEASGERRLFLVGHSLGGALACSFAGRHPEAVRGVATLAGLYDFARASRFVRMLGRAAAALESFGVAPYLLPATLRTDLVGAALRLSRRAWDSPLAGLMPLQAWCPGSMEPDVLRESIARSFEPASLGITLGLARMAVGGVFCDEAGESYLDAFERLEETPLCVLAGCSDLLVSAEDSRAAYDRSRSRDRTLRRFEPRDGGTGWGHIDLLLGRSAPAHVWPFLREWLGSR
ncbi:MAG TPA: alpha/beta hydrolase [Planctomycetota bacterium]|nr:alpha/beta hydrolase [Planctomycetota bacterium]